MAETVTPSLDATSSDAIVFYPSELRPENKPFPPPLRLLAKEVPSLVAVSLRPMVAGLRNGTKEALHYASNILRFPLKEGKEVTFIGRRVGPSEGEYIGDMAGRWMRRIGSFVPADRFGLEVAISQGDRYQAKIDVNVGLGPDGDIFVSLEPKEDDKVARSADPSKPDDLYGPFSERGVALADALEHFERGRSDEIRQLTQQVERDNGIEGLPDEVIRGALEIFEIFKGADFSINPQSGRATGVDGYEYRDLSVADADTDDPKGVDREKDYTFFSAEARQGVGLTTQERVGEFGVWTSGKVQFRHRIFDALTGHWYTLRYLPIVVDGVGGGKRVVNLRSVDRFTQKQTDGSILLDVIRIETGAFESGPVWEDDSIEIALGPSGELVSLRIEKWMYRSDGSDGPVAVREVFDSGDIGDGVRLSDSMVQSHIKRIASILSGSNLRDLMDSTRWRRRVI